MATAVFIATRVAGEATVLAGAGRFLASGDLAAAALQLPA